MRCRRHIRRIILAGLVLAVGFFVLVRLLRPPVMEWSEIYGGVYLTVKEIPRGTDGYGRMMIVEVHWDTPGIRLAGRGFDYPVDPADSVSPHYRLVPADWALAREQAAILVNTAAYQPEQPWRSLPGLPVRSLETVVVDGQVSHVHPHSYLLYWDDEEEAHLLPYKPPDPGSLEKAVLGIGLQGIPVSNGRAREHALDHKEIIMPRTFIGIDPERKILWLMAFEHASGYYMLGEAVAAGVQYGGMLDSGDATHLLVGRQGLGVRPHSGIRHWRPLGPYLTVFAEPVHP